MNIYKFGKGLIATSTNNSSLSISKLETQQKLNTPVSSLLQDTITLKFTSVKSLDKLILDLQEVRKSMLKRKLKNLLESFK